MQTLIVPASFSFLFMQDIMEMVSGVPVTSGGDMHGSSLKTVLLPRQWGSSVAPSNMQVNSYVFPAHYPSTLKKSIKTISGYQVNRGFAYNDRSGYCPNKTTFKAISASRLTIDSSSSSSAVDYQTSFPEEYNTVEKIGAYAIEQKSSYQYVQ